MFRYRKVYFWFTLHGFISKIKSKNGGWIKYLIRLIIAIEWSVKKKKPGAIIYYNDVAEMLFRLQICRKVGF